MVDKPERLMTLIDAPNESLHHTTRGPQKILSQEVQIMVARKKALEESDGKDAQNFDKDIEI